MKLILLILFSALQFSSFTYGQHSEIFNKALQHELLEMTEKEQDLRLQWMNTSDPTTKEFLRQEIIQIDNLHLISLKEIVKSYDWPGRSLIGLEGSHAFWLLVQHTPDRLFQNQCLDLLEQAVINQEASPIDLAYLKDRVYMHAGKKQIYGTQLNEDLSFYPIEDEEHVNERRLAIGLPSIEEYLEVIKELFKNKI
jgi:hypothetical protein